eukprot:GEMP01060433.1.p1 GENE.GEMP01060433.1~~GEMP01060433.1.p1  ORF type:complete len:100 (+),score=11.42 GEMP01060433.1:1121-1420(+)
MTYIAHFSINSLTYLEFVMLLLRLDLFIAFIIFNGLFFLFVIGLFFFLLLFLVFRHLYILEWRFRIHAQLARHKCVEAAHQIARVGQIVALFDERDLEE